MDLSQSAALAGAARNFGLDVDQLVDFAIKTAQSEGVTVQAVLQKMIDSDLEMQANQLQTLGLDKFEDVLRGSEEADNSNFFSVYNQEERDKGRAEGKEDKRLRKAAANIRDEARYRAGEMYEEGPEFEGRREYRSEQKYPAPYDPEQDDFVVKKKGRIIRFKKEGKQDYRPTNRRDGIIKRRMVKYRPGETRQRFDPRTNQVVTHNIPPEAFYPGARNEEPYDATVTGKAEWKDVYQRLVSHIDSGAITDPQEYEAALKLKEDMKANLNPGYAKARDFDRGVALVRQDRQGLTLDEIERRTQSDLRALTADGDLVRPTDSRDSSFGNISASPEEIRAIREAAIFKSIHSPTEVEPAKGRRNLVDLVSAEAALRADYGSRPSAARQQFNNNIALRDAIINDTEAGNFANDQLGRLGEVSIQGKGYKKNGKPDWIAEAPITFSDPTTYTDAYRLPGPIPVTGQGDATVYFDRPGGDPLAVQGLDIKPLSVNAPDSAQVNNSPVQRPVISDMTDLLINQQYRTRESGVYPQADISGALSTFNTRLDRVKSIAPGLVGNARSLNDVENIVNNVLGNAADSGARLNTFGTKERSSAPGPMEVLGKMRYTSTEVQQLSNALLQLQLGSTNGINTQGKADYFGGTGSYMSNYPIGLGSRGEGRSVDLSAEGPAVSLGRDRMSFGEIEQMSDYTVGDNLDTANQRVAPAFRQLTGENIEGSPQERRETLDDARRPFIAQVKGELVPIDGKRANPNYRFNATGETDPVKIEAAVRNQARGRATKKNPRNLDREEQNIYNATVVNARHYPDVVKVARAGSEGRKRNQASIKRNEYELATSTGGSGMGGGTRPPVAAAGAEPWSERPATGPGFTNTGFQDALPYAGSTSARGPQQGPTQEGYPRRKRSFQERRENAGRKFSSFQNNPRYERSRRNARIAAVSGGVGAAIAGIDGLINGERDRRDQEAQY